MNYFFREQWVPFSVSKAISVSCLIIFLFACRIQLVPVYDKEVKEQIEYTSKKVNHFYLTMLEMEEDHRRAYDNFIDDYIAIEVELHSILNKNKYKPLNKNSVRICEITLSLWQKYKAEHKKEGTLSSGIIKLNQSTFNDLFYAMIVAENAKKITNNPPQ